jgi:exo-beta-1,3-glucanase (GH17 family)
MHNLLLRGLFVGTLCSSVTFGLVGNAAPCDPAPPNIRRQYFNRIGIGANYGPHYPCWPTDGGTNPVECYDYKGSDTASLQDAKNYVFQTSVPLDLAQIQAAGFDTVRAYGENSSVWIAMINAANTQGPGTTNLNIVYQVALCSGDSNGNCKIANRTVPFANVLNASMSQLQKVISEVTPAVFQKVVKLVIVGNENLVIIGHDTNNKPIYNTQDIINAIERTKTTLQDAGIKLTTGSGNQGVDVSHSSFIGQMSAEGRELVPHFTPGAPVIENLYPAQFSKKTVPDAKAAIGMLKEAVNKLQNAYQTDHPAMIGETGWWTAGWDGSYQANDRQGTLADAQAYYKDLYQGPDSYVRSCAVPTLIFEAFDEPAKPPRGANQPNQSVLAEQHYGVMDAFNTAKGGPINPGQNDGLLPHPRPDYKDHPETRNAAEFKFVLSPYPGSLDQAKPMTFGIKNPGDQQSRKITVKPIDIPNLDPTKPGAGWPAFNLQVNSEVSIYRNVRDSEPLCSNTVIAIDNTVQGSVPAFTGGTWKSTKAEGCARYPDPDVNWGRENVYDENVYMNPIIPTNTIKSHQR